MKNAKTSLAIRTLFQAYIDQLPAANPKERKFPNENGRKIITASERLGVSVTYVYSIISGRRGISPDLAQKIHDDSGGAFDRCDLVFGP